MSSPNTSYPTALAWNPESAHLVAPCHASMPMHHLVLYATFVGVGTIDVDTTEDDTIEVTFVDVTTMVASDTRLQGAPSCHMKSMHK